MNAGFYCFLDDIVDRLLSFQVTPPERIKEKGIQRKKRNDATQGAGVRQCRIRCVCTATVTFLVFDFSFSCQDCTYALASTFSISLTIALLDRTCFHKGKVNLHSTDKFDFNHAFPNTNLVKNKKYRGNYLLFFCHPLRHLIPSESCITIYLFFFMMLLIYFDLH